MIDDSNNKQDNGIIIVKFGEELRDWSNMLELKLEYSVVGF